MFLNKSPRSKYIPIPLKTKNYYAFLTPPDDFQDIKSGLFHEKVFRPLFLPQMEKMVIAQQSHKRSRAQRAARKLAAQQILFPHFDEKNLQFDLEDDYVVVEKDDVNMHLQAGFSPITPRTSIILRVVDEVFLKKYRPETHYEKSFASGLMNIEPTADFFVKLVEDVTLFIYDLSSATTRMSRYLAFIKFAKLRGIRGIATTVNMAIISEIIGLTVSCTKDDPVLEIQSAEEFVGGARKLLDSYKALKNSEVAKKLSMVGLFAMSYSLLDTFGITFSKLNYDKVQEAAVKRDFYLGPTMIHGMCDSLLFLLEKGIQCFKTGSVDPILHNTTRYQEWMDTVIRLQRESKLINNPEPHGICMSQFLADLSDTIEKGEAIKRMVMIDDKGMDKRLIINMLADLQMLKAYELTRQLAQKERKAPFAVLLSGPSSVGKSALTTALYYHYGKLFDLPIEPEFKYTRQGVEKHWTNFSTYQWCIQFDDIGYLKPQNAPDPTLLEFLNVNNNVPFTPEQAALEDKGRTPVTAELLLATTNTPGLNLGAYFSCPFAIARRFPLLVEVKPKADVCIEGRLNTEAISSKRPVIDGSYPDLWEFEVLEPFIKTGARNETPSYRSIKTFSNINDFLCFFGERADKHRSTQTAALSASNCMKNVKLCKTCKRSEKTCICQTKCPRCQVQPLGWNLECELCVKTREDIIQLGFSDPRLSTPFSIQSEEVLVEQGEGAIRISLYETLKRIGTEKREMYQSWFARNIAFRYCPQHREGVTHNCVYTRMRFLGPNGEFEGDSMKKIFNQCINEESLLYRFRVWCVNFFLVSMWFYLCRLYLAERDGIYWQEKFLLRYLNRGESYRILFKGLKQRVCSRVDLPTYLMDCIKVLTVVGGTMFLVKQLASLLPTEVKEPEIYIVPEEIQTVFTTTTTVIKPAISVQSSTDEGTPPLQEEVVSKPYYFHDPFRLTTLDITPTISSQGPIEVLKKKLKQAGATFLMSTLPHDGRAQKLKVNCATCIGGQVYMLNNHGLPEADVFYLSVKSEPENGAINGNLCNILVSSNMVRRYPQFDLAFIELKHLPPGKNLMEYFPQDTFNGKFNGVLCGTGRDGQYWENQQVGLTLQKTKICKLDITAPVWWGFAQRETRHGDCGGVLISTEPLKNAIMGIHLFGAEDGTNKVGAIQIPYNIVHEAFKSFTSSNIQHGEINISAPGCEMKLTDLHRKSPFRYMEKGTARVFGSLTGFRTEGKSHVGPTYIAETIKRKFGCNPKYVAPPMNWQPWYEGLKDLVRPVTLLNQDILDEVTQNFTDDILNILPKSELEKLRVYDNVTTMNGAPGVAFVDKINRNTSVGYPYKNTKRNFIHPIESPINTDFVMYDENIMKMIEEQIVIYERGDMTHAIYNGNLKDEAKPPGKMTRTFMGAGGANAFIQRKYFLSVVKCIQENSFIFEAGPGMVAQCAEWEKLFEYLNKHPLDRTIAGDYGKFDKRMAPMIILAAYRILIKICEASGNFTETQLKVMFGMSYDVAFPVVDYNGTIAMFFGSNPSGHPLTVIINGVVNSLYMRYCFAILSGKNHAKDFKNCVRLMTYGDDNIMTVSPDCDFFNHTAIQKVLADADIVYTMAEKSAQSVPFIHLDESSFLKRRFVQDDDIGAIVAPIEHESILKMLTSRVVELNISAQAHSIAVISSAVREYFFYGKKEFEIRSQQLKEVVRECMLEPYLQNSTFPSWKELYCQFWLNSKHVKLQRLGFASLQSFQPDSTECGGPVSQTLRSLFTTNISITSEREVPPTCVVQRDAPQVIFASAEQFSIQSDIIETEGKASELDQENVQFLDESDGYEVGFGTIHNVTSSDQTANTDLGKFLSRPVRIASFTWAESDGIGTTRTFSPWNLFFNDARIKYKLNNFAFMQATLKVKVLINASPFYYGAMIGAYTPNPGLTPSTIQPDLGTRYFIPYSQQPHMWIYPQESKADTMTLPFFYHKNWLNIQSAVDLTNMGTLNFINYTALASANGATGVGVSVQVYAWAEDVKLSGLSVGLAMQSDTIECCYGLQSDEYGTGIVSKPASAIANGAKYFENIPIIGTFATATRIGASAVSAIASLFGWTNVPVISDTQSLRPTAFPQLASTEIGFPAEKLTLDSKNELTVDPTIMGLPADDEMAITNRVMHESYLTTANWTSANNVDDLLFTSLVTPLLADSDGLTNAKCYLTPMAWVSQLFKEWRGDIIFRFRFVASPYHKGRVRISFDPSGYSGENLVSDAVSQTVVMTKIIDLGKDSDIELRIPYQQATAFMQVQNSLGAVNWSTSLTPSLTRNVVFDNGYLTMRVTTILTAPIAVTTIPIMIFVRGASNLEFANPTDLQPFTTWAPQSAEIYGDPNSIVAGKDSTPNSEQYLVNFGECVKSLRAVLRRQTLSKVNMPPNVAIFHQIVRQRFTRWPLMNGFDTVGGNDSAFGLVVTGSTFKYNWTCYHPHSWISPAFVGQRGSMQWTFNVDTVQAIRHIRVYRDTTSSIPTGTTTAGLLGRGTPSAAAAFYAINCPAGASGQALTSQYTNAGLTVQLPNYTRFVYQSTAPSRASVPSAVDGGDIDAYALEISYNNLYAGAQDNIFSRVWEYAGIGTDYGLHFFLNVPTYWIYNGTPVPN